MIRQSKSTVVPIAAQGAYCTSPNFTPTAVQSASTEPNEAQADDEGIKRQAKYLLAGESLQSQIATLTSLVQSMPQGIAMFDAGLELVVCNAYYASMYDLTPEQVKPGSTVRDIFEARLANGHYCVRDTEGFVDSWASEFGSASARIQELADGRVISVLRRQTPEGGRVVTHEDVTERHRLSSKVREQFSLLEAQEKALNNKNAQIDAALNNMVQGLAMFDDHDRLILANARFGEIYDIESEALAPGMSLREILGVSAGYSSELEFEDIQSPLRNRKASEYIRTLHDGRHIAVSVQSMKNGGVVTTHHDITQQRNFEARIAHLAHHDALTDLPNRMMLAERLEQATARVSHGEIAAVHFLDLDKFKLINDSLGHGVGDELLKLVAKRLRSITRETDTIARLGGDEFAIVQVDISHVNDALGLAERVISALGEPYDVNGHSLSVGASIGIAFAPSDGIAADVLMRNADLALYRAKEQGRGTYRCFEAAMDEQAQFRRKFEFRLRKAVANGEFELHYQPIVNFTSGQISGMEALVRWRDPENGMISPAQFIPMAEETGLILQLGEWIIRTACMTAANWPLDWKIAVNISPVQFASQALISVVVDALTVSGIAPTRLELEVTESVLLQDSGSTLAKLNKLRALGIRIAMDDFGTGYSSLSYLQKFPFDKIKIDQSFVRTLFEATGSLCIVRAVSALAKGLGMETTAEGVETIGQSDALKAEGCTEMQGYLFSRPVPASDIERLFVSQYRAAKFVSAVRP